MHERIEEILSWYEGNPPGVVANIARMLNTGTLAHTGKMVILPVDQGFEHGPARSFAQVPEWYDPRHHLDMAILAGCNAYAAPLGTLEAALRRENMGRIPLILKLNSSDSLSPGGDPCPAVTASVQDALRLGCSAIGLTIYPGSSMRNTMYEGVRDLVSHARAVGLPTVIWSYPRGSGISKQGEQAIDVVAYAVQLAAQLGAHIVKVKPPTAYIEQAEAKKVYESVPIPIESLSQRVRHVVQSCFGGRRIVIFSGGAAKGDKDVIAEIKQLYAGGACGSIMGRNVFQRPKTEALALLRQVMDIYRGA